jgi:AAA+ ATPase superfamily predicted ATPase
MGAIIGRTFEKSELESYYQSESSEFVAVFGRRRVGKTYLIREFFGDKFNFHLTGLANADFKSQLVNFNIAIRDAGFDDAPLTKSWIYAFQQLRTLLEKSKKKKKVIFLDELPWLDTPKSNFLSALEHFWNSWASGRNDILLIVCGSSTSWMTDKLLKSKGGLHNRITRQLKIEQFTLRECSDYLKSAKIVWEQYQITECYMILGGIPYYWSLLKKGMSLAQNIDLLFFGENARLKDEFRNLYAALFKNSDRYVHVIEVLGKKNSGLTRQEIIQSMKEISGGGLTKVLDDLENCDFIRSFYAFDKKLRDKIYQLSDFYTLFYFRFGKKSHSGKNFWSSMIDSTQHRAWTGYAFEQVCIAHATQIQQSLGISGVHCNFSSWRSPIGIEKGAQIDLIIDRNDNVINLCEMKYSINKFSIPKKYSAELRNKVGVFKAITQTKKSIFLTFITTFGLAQNAYSGLIQSEVEMNDLFL